VRLRKVPAGQRAPYHEAVPRVGKFGAGLHAKTTASRIAII